MDELLENLKEGVIVLDEQDNTILFKNKEAAKKLNVKEGGQLKYVFDASNSRSLKSIELEEPVFGAIEQLEPEGLNYCGFLKDMNNIQANLGLKEIIKQQRSGKLDGMKKIYKIDSRFRSKRNN